MSTEDEKNLISVEDEKNLISVENDKKICGMARKKFYIISAVITLLVAGSVAVGIYFGVFNRSSTSSQTLNMGQISASTSTLSKRAATAPSNLLGSTSAYNYAEVVGIRLNVVNIALTGSDQSLSAQTLTPDSGSLTFGSGETEVRVRQSVSIAPGIYNRLSVNLKNSYSLKAYCKTSSWLVYTTASGIQKVNVNTSSVRLILIIMLILLLGLPLQEVLLMLHSILKLLLLILLLLLQSLPIRQSMLWLIRIS
jgi:hypothetical protein